MCPKYQKSIPTNFTTTFDCCLEKLHRFDRFFLDEAKMCTTSQSNLDQALDLKHKTYDETDKRCPCHVHSQHFQFDISVWPLTMPLPFFHSLYLQIEINRFKTFCVDWNWYFVYLANFFRFDSLRFGSILFYFLHSLWVDQKRRVFFLFYIVRFSWRWTLSVRWDGTFFANANSI